ncbi:phage portal protein [Virgibacillus sp. C22-A2]|uniref:Phage portal protein n=1 Tax=Virgibacillus tibetensis TaxID=3042313 RepID=A0ABU6KB31_9BACI|nr:phage portal protein [Virgibacillus sp. C22-A2]
MYPSSPTHTEELIQMIKSNSPKTVDIIKEYIENHDTKAMDEGIKYYYKENDITDRVIYKYDNAGNKLIDHEATNNKLASGYHKLLVDQKTSYLVGEPLTISSKSDKDIEPITETLGDEFNDTLPELVTAASNKGREWLHPYIDTNGEFDYIIIPAQEGIPIYDNTKRKSLIGFIRYYELDDGTKKIELWDDKQVTFYEETDQGIVMDVSYEDNPQPHFYYGPEDNKKGYSWSKEGKKAVPFIEFANNSKRVNDLLFYKDFIDATDNIISDTTNTIEDVQQFLYVIRGYEGQDIAEAVTNFKRFKGVAVSSDENSGVDILQGEVPMQSISTHLDRMKDDIFQFGQGVDISSDKYGNSPSGIALKFLFSLLDMKASVLERKFEKGLREFIWYVCEYLEISGQGTYDYKNIEFVFNKSMLMNELEQVTIAQQSLGVISQETIVANHPWTTNVQQELDRLEEAKSAYPSVEDDEELEEDEEE